MGKESSAEVISLSDYQLDDERKGVTSSDSPENSFEKDSRLSEEKYFPVDEFKFLPPTKVGFKFLSSPYNFPEFYSAGMDKSNVSDGDNHRASPIEDPESMSNDHFTSKDYIDARTREVRAGNDARFAEITSEIDGVKRDISNLKDNINIRFDNVPTTNQLIVSSITIVITTVGLIMGIFAFGGDRFDGGVQLSSFSLKEAQEALENADAAKKQAEETAIEIKTIREQLDVLMKLMTKKVNE